MIEITKSSEKYFESDVGIKLWLFNTSCSLGDRLMDGLPPLTSCELLFVLVYDSILFVGSLRISLVCWREVEFLITCEQKRERGEVFCLWLPPPWVIMGPYTCMRRRYLSYLNTGWYITCDKIVKICKFMTYSTLHIYMSLWAMYYMCTMYNSLFILYINYTSIKHNLS